MSGILVVIPITSCEHPDFFALFAVKQGRREVTLGDLKEFVARTIGEDVSQIELFLNFPEVGYCKVKGQDYYALNRCLFNMSEYRPGEAVFIKTSRYVG